jgi:hypothetical protein
MIPREWVKGGRGHRRAAPSQPHGASNRISSSTPQASAQRRMRATVGLAFHRSVWLTACWIVFSRPARSR